MNGMVSVRLREALEYLIKTKKAKNMSEIARKIHSSKSSLSMSSTGAREVPLKTLLNLSDAYGISFDWLRKGEGEMLGRTEDIAALKQRIFELEERLSAALSGTPCLPHRGSDK